MLNGSCCFWACQEGQSPSTRCQCSAGRLGSPPNCPLISCDSFGAALQNGHPDCLSYWHRAGVTHREKKDIWHSDPIDTIYAAGRPSAEMLMYVHDVVGLPWDTQTFAAAARFGDIDCLSYAYASRCPCKSKTCASAAKAGSLRCLAYAHEHRFERDSRFVLYSAACSGQLESLKYAHAHGCPYIASRPFTSYWSGPEPVLQCLAVIGSSVACLAYVHEAMSCAWDIKGSECELAFEAGELEMLQYIPSHGGNLCTLSEVPCPVE